MNSQRTSEIRMVAILGGGPAASTLATLLARRGLRVAIFHVPKRAPLIVGESLVPAIIPMLQMLGVEKEIAAFSTLKPGATFNLSTTDNYSFFFDQLAGDTARYAYNVPRDQFDDTLLAAARTAGARIIEAAAHVELIPGTDRVRLTDETLAACNDFFTDGAPGTGPASFDPATTSSRADARRSGQPDFIVDATGRLRLLPKLLAIPAHEVGRGDTALFAHVDATQLDYPGHVHTTRLDHGWSWRIPLPGRVSVGMVVGTEHLLKFGETKEERFDNLLKQDSTLSRVAKDAKRLTPVMEYVNYSLVSERITGANWALVGDTAGFIDPVFSSGLFLGMNGAVTLAHAIGQGSPAAFQAYAKEAGHHLETWQEIVGYFYDGRLFTFFHVGEMMRRNPLVRLLNPHITKHLGRIFSGAASTSAYSLGLLRFGMKNGLRNENPGRLSIR